MPHYVGEFRSMKTIIAFWTVVLSVAWYFGG